ncbi:MAG: hypothetical protein JXL97_08320 [Bacteroidales bacterium]|nr:hypothetical protein [Bacteroidales bacterium]
MKIEIAENLIYSYLKHVEGCRIVQTNWKTSNQWKITEYEEKQSRELFEKINNSALFQGIFKNNSFDQLIKQAEIDVIGLNTTEKSIFGIDVAFHAAGLNYGSTEETALRILKKIFRTVFIMQTYFSDFDKFNSFFVTPKVNPSTEKPIRNLIEEANKIIGDDMISIDFVANESFYSSIVDSTIKNIDDDNDTSELFLRSIKLLQLDKRVQSDNTKKDYTKRESVYTKTPSQTNKREVDGMKIGQFVQYNMRKVYEQNLASKDEIQKLQDKFYSKKVFDQNYEILRSADKEITGNDGRNRYYAKEKFFGDYYLNSQWVERHWEPFLSWLRKINKNNAP